MTSGPQTHRAKSGIIYFATATLLANSAFGAVQIRQNAKHETTEVSGLFGDSTCSSIGVFGRVVKREFAADALTLTGFVVEHGDGTRQFINVEIPPHLDMTTRESVFDGLQRLLKEGRLVTGRALACGAAGRVLTLEQIR